jgi:uncharacterized protein (DUF1810 family)
LEDPFNLNRFVTAQDDADTFAAATAELRSGRKVSHWMWFVFPQLAGLGMSPASQYYAISSLAEARAYRAHEVLGERLAECGRILAGLQGRTAESIFGPLDAQKLRSSMTLFLRAAPDDPLFGNVLSQYFGGEPDAATDELL